MISRHFCCHNLSPRGDGNSCRYFLHCCYYCHNLSPRGDGNMLALPNTFFVIMVAIHPRKGTVIYHCEHLAKLNMLQLIPVRGREPLNNHQNNQCRMLQSTPRKGTKKALSEKTERAFSCLYNSKKIRPPYRFGTAASNCSADYFCGLHAHSGSTRPWEQFS